MTDHLDFKNWRVPEPPKLTVKSCPACGCSVIETTFGLDYQTFCTLCSSTGPRCRNTKDAIAAWNAMPRREDLSHLWVPVTERLPQKPNTYPVLRRLRGDGPLFLSFDWRRFDPNVTHWLDADLVPLPESKIGVLKNTAAIGARIPVVYAQAGQHGPDQSTGEVEEPS